MRLRALLLGALYVCGVILLCFPQPVRASGASLSFSPSKAEYLLNSTFDVSIIVNTAGQAINAVDAHINFPPDKLQVVNPSVGKSFIELWVAGPSYSNTDGKITFQGGLPHPGITTSAGIISTISFRAKSAGPITLTFGENSKVLADDGQGTNILEGLSTGTFTIKVAPPGGPTVTSPTHEDRTAWYNNRSVTLVWDAPDNAKEFSFVLDQNPSTIPPESTTTTEQHHSVTVNSDGLWFFHIRAKNAYWGGTTHFPIHIDTIAPAKFTPTLDANVIQAGIRHIVSFRTTDSASGIDHYEIRVVSENEVEGTSTFFVEEKSPYQLPALEPGNYTIIARAYDKAGNVTDGSVSIRVVATTIPAITKNSEFIPYIILVTILLILLLTWLYRRNRRYMVKRITRDLEQVSLSVEQQQKQLSDLIDAESVSHNRLQSLTQANTIPVQTSVHSVTTPEVEKNIENSPIK